MTEQDRYTVTSALPYVHGIPHLGNAVGSVLPADIFHRYLDLRGKENIFICGSDVHGTPLELEAMEREMEPEKLAKQQHEKVKKAYDDLEMDFTHFGQTDSDYNRRQTHEMFVELYCNGHVQKVTQRMPYCRDDERFLPDRYIEGECPHCGGLARGDQCDDCGKLVEPEELKNTECQICGGNKIEFRDTKHLSLDLKNFKTELLQWLNERQRVPEGVEKEVENNIKEAEERTITRDQNWGFDIPVQRVNERIEEEDLEVEKLDPYTFRDKVLYVWFDAPIGYIGFTREHFDDGEEWKNHWADDDTHVYYSIGKDNTIFHTVIWPSMLLGSSTDEIEYNLPEYEFIQNYMMWEDKAFSKSRNVGVWIDEAVEMYPADYWRFYMVRHMPDVQDTNFSWEDFESEINNVLNDTVGNFVNRTLALVEKWFDNEVPVADLEYEDNQAITEAEEIVDEYVQNFEDHNLRGALEDAVALARHGDQYLSEEEPWNGEDRREAVIATAVQFVRGVGTLMYPFTPEASERIEEMLDVEIHTEEGYDELQDPLLGGVGAGEELGEREVLFEKIEVDEDDKENEDEDEDSTFNKDTVSVDEFDRMDIRIGEVLEVEKHPNADKLYKVQINVGEETLQTCAGLKNHYSPEELEGKRIVVLANLEPAELRGEKSECMMLAAEDNGGKVSLLGTDEEMDVGSEVR